MASKSLRFYGYSRCSTCRKALAWLDENKIPYENIDIVSNPPGKEIVRKALKQFGERKYLFNTSGISYRQIGSAAVKCMSEDEAITALCNDGKLIKRPFLLIPTGRVLLGFKQDIWTQELLD